VRCGACQQPFDALTHLQEEPSLATPPPAASAPSPPPPPPAAPPPNNNDVILARQIANSLKPKAPRRTPSIFSRSSSPWPRRILIALPILTLIVGALSYTHRQSETLSHSATLRPWVVALCTLSRCAVAPQQALERILVVDPLIRSHPQRPNGLLITATLHNGAPFDQPWPEVELIFTAITGEILARRRFVAAQYLAAATRAQHPFIAGMEAALRLEIIDPGQQASGYELQLHPAYPP
jgi:hypothetical protein